ncbi:MAG: hypothetical protein OEV91_08230, partial [Desulfobulbaceae bacterium]|nr:hypothetical protein [Desulfobulbaceae bacterium]
YDRRQEEGKGFWEGDADQLVSVVRTRAHFALEERFKGSDLADAIFTGRFLFRKIRPELTAPPYASFSRSNRATPEERQRIRMTIDLPRYFEAVVRPWLRG